MAKSFRTIPPESPGTSSAEKRGPAPGMPAPSLWPSTTVRTQGNDALAVKDRFLLTTLTSLPVASTATALAGMGASRTWSSFEKPLR